MKRWKHKGLWALVIVMLLIGVGVWLNGVASPNQMTADLGRQIAAGRLVSRDWTLPTKEAISPVVAETASTTVPLAKENKADDEGQERHCTLSISCLTVLDNWENLAVEKRSLIPANGILLETEDVTFTEGESVFDVLLRQTKAHKIHLEFSNTPMYQSSYIEGIGNLYEFDCGDLSGWMYCVNGIFPSYGCSRYILADGDKVEWIYTCDLGRDIGDNVEEDK